MAEHAFDDLDEMSEDLSALAPALLDDSLNDLVAEIQEGNPVLRELALSPRHQLAFRTFAWLRAGIILGQCLVDREFDLADLEDGHWVEELWEDDSVRVLVTTVVEELGYQIASDPTLVHARAIRPDPALKLRFLAAARRRDSWAE